MNPPRRTCFAVISVAPGAVVLGMAFLVLPRSHPLGTRAAEFWLSDSTAREGAPL